MNVGHIWRIRVINNHIVVLDPSKLVLLGDAAESVQEETITKLHDVGLVDTGDFLQPCSVYSST